MIAQSIPEEVASGLRLHQAGRLDEAARLYEAAMARYPSNADACCLLGVVRNQQGRSTVAVPLIQRALALRPGVAAFHANLGLAWQAQGTPTRGGGRVRQGPGAGPEDVAVHVNRGVIIRALGQNELALDHFRRARPSSTRGWHRPDEPRGLADGDGPAREALTHCQVAVAIEPRLVEAHINLGNVLRVLGRLAEARACYQQAMRMDPTRAQAASGLGLTAIQVGSWDEALDWFRKAVALEPRSVEFLRHLAEVASDRKLYAEVRSCCERNLEIDPDHGAIAHERLGYISHEAGRAAEEARRRYQVAIRLKPDLAVAHHNLGVLESEMGDLTEAEEHLRMTLKLEPQHARRRGRGWRSCWAAACRSTRSSRLRDRLTDPELAPIDRANLLFGLAKVHDSRDEFAETASCLAEANGLILSEQDRLGNGYDPGRGVRLVRLGHRGIHAGRFERLAGAGSDTQRPVFIIGLPRSGTTLLEQILASHPAVHGAGEIPMARRSFEEIPELLGRSDEPMSCMPDVDAAIIGELARRTRIGCGRSTEPGPSGSSPRCPRTTTTSV